MMLKKITFNECLEDIEEGFIAIDIAEFWLNMIFPSEGS